MQARVPLESKCWCVHEMWPTGPCGEWLQEPEMSNAFSEERLAEV